MTFMEVVIGDEARDNGDQVTYVLVVIVRIWLVPWAFSSNGILCNCS